MKFKSLIINGLAVAAATVAFTMPASATKSINLTGISGYPPAATWIGAFVDVYMPSVNAELLPAVMVPYLRSKAGRSLESFS